MKNGSETTPMVKTCVTKELYILTGMETFAKEPELLKLLRELKSTPVRRYKNKKVHWFLSYVCNRKFAAFGCFAEG